MTLPAALPPVARRADRPPAQRRNRTQCLSAAWADVQPSVAAQSRRERRRAVCSWSVGYGTLHELDEWRAAAAVAAVNEQVRNKGKVAAVSDNGNRNRLVTSPTIALPHESPQAASRRRGTERLGGGARTRVDFLGMPGIKSILNRRRNSGEGADGDTTSSPLVKTPKGGGDGLKAASSLASLRKCETVLALTSVLRSSSSSSSIEPLQATNRLRASPPASRMCSRCSSLLTLASASRYSLNSSAGFVQVGNVPTQQQQQLQLCKLCLAEVPTQQVVHIGQCNCSFCIECMKAYVQFEIAEGAYDISCPDAQCPSQGVLQQDEIKRLVGNELAGKHLKYRINREVELDKTRTWCPRAGCETVCTLCPTQKCLPQSVYCPTCSTDFCSNCKREWHEGLSCEEHAVRLAKDGKEEQGIPFDGDLIKCCPMCKVPIEKDEGCAQMMCKRCKHVFCWYCLASLDDDFLLRHYDKGPCKNKLGHSRASVIWHRTQVIGIFAGFGILLLVASPLLLLAAPCIVCCKCRVCNVGTTKLDNEEDQVPGEES